MLLDRWLDADPPENMKVWPRVPQSDENTGCCPKHALRYIYKHGLAVACMLRGVSEEVVEAWLQTFVRVLAEIHDVVWILNNDPNRKAVAVVVT